MRISQIKVLNTWPSSVFTLFYKGLEPKTVLSQWYPTANLYPGRSVEGMYILKDVPVLNDKELTLPPKDLVKECVKTFADLKVGILGHYNISCPNRKEWEIWFNTHEPSSQDVKEYTAKHCYSCPIKNFFKRSIQFKPTWQPSIPVTSPTIFPSYVVVALPSIQCQFDPHNSFPAYMEIATLQPTGADGRESVADTPHSR